MRSASRWTFIALLLLAVPAASFAQSASSRAAVGASLEVLTRNPDLVILAQPGSPTTLTLEPAVGSPGTHAAGTASAVRLDVARTLYARVSVDTLATEGSAHAEALAEPRFDVLNQLDTPMEVHLRVSVPGEFPTPGGLEPNPYFDEGSTYDAYMAYARVRYFVTALAPISVEGDPGYALGVLRESRPALGPLPGTPGGPTHFDSVGVPFFTDYVTLVPPSFTAHDDVIEIILWDIGLHVRAESISQAYTSLASFPLVVADAPSCPTAPTSAAHASAAARLAVRDPLCRAGRSGAAPVPLCGCLRDDARRSQRCSFLFSDLDASVLLPAPARAGERVDADWTFRPWTLGDAEVSLSAEILEDGKWKPVPAKLPSGNMSDGKEVRAKIAFDMPKRPTILRTHLTHLPKGAKTPIESSFDTVIALKTGSAKSSRAE